MVFFLNQRDIATIAMDVTTVFIIVGLILQSGVMRKRGRRDDRLFFMLLVADFFVAVFESVSYLADGKDFYGARFLNGVGITIFYLFFGLFSYLWLRYTDERFFNGNTFISRHKLLVALPMIIMMILLICNLFGRFIFWVDENNGYHREFMFVPMYLLFSAYLFGGFGMIYRYRWKLGRKRRLVPGWLYVMPVALVLVIPHVFGGISMAAVGLACGLVFTHIGSMNEQIALNILEDEYDGD